ncbi:hypothetical protein SLA2020_283780 [Shorea laevis]
MRLQNFLKTLKTVKRSHPPNLSPKPNQAITEIISKTLNPSAPNPFLSISTPPRFSIFSQTQISNPRNACVSSTFSFGTNLSYPSSLIWKPI